MIPDVDSQLLKAGFNKLIRLVRSLLKTPEATASIVIRRASGEILITLQITGGSEPTLDPDFDGLAAYLAIYHHRGSVTVRSWSARGGEIEIVLGGSNNDGEEDFIAMLNHMER